MRLGMCVKGGHISVQAFRPDAHGLAIANAQVPMRNIVQHGGFELSRNAAIRQKDVRTVANVLDDVVCCHGVLVREGSCVVGGRLEMGIAQTPMEDQQGISCFEGDAIDMREPASCLCL